MIYYQTIITDDNGETHVVENQFEYKPGLALPDNEYVQNVVKAIEYLRTTKKGQKLVDAVLDREEVLKVRNVEFGFGPNYIPAVFDLEADEFSRWKDGSLVEVNILNWNPNEGGTILDRQERETGGSQSSAFMLGHEFKHFLNFTNNRRKFIRKTFRASKWYGHKEEKRTMKWERRMARELNEPARNVHSGRPKRVANVTESNSTKFKKKHRAPSQKTR